MAASSWNPKCPRIRGDASGRVAPIYSFPEGSTQTYKAGALVYLEASSGQITICADSADIIGGIVQEDATGTAGTSQKVQIVRAGDLVEFTCIDETDDGEVAADTLYAGNTYDIELNSGVAYAEHDSEHATTENLHFVAPMYDSLGVSTNRGYFTIEINSLNFGRTA
jgi:hypothetical protein